MHWIWDAVSALEHVESEEIFARKLVEIAEGTAENGVACLVLNSEVREENKDTGEMLVPQFEVNLPTKKMVTYVEEAFRGWKILKRNVSEQEYEIPRGEVTSKLTTRVVTYVVRKSAF
ncbi:hypothetical protein SAMN02910358_00789 [Lachnospiraceae bacterium XBB1006]|nr:hypothetical protein SAMN02910358_00789 [Lachnospiraceae bacterium XBB1006]